MKIFRFLFVLLLASCGGGGGGGSSSPIYVCSGSGFSYVCVPTSGGGGSSTPAPSASPFPIATSIQALVTNGINANGLYTDPYTAGTFNITKARTTVTFNGQSVTQLRTTTTWTGTYITPYDVYYDSNNQVYGFHINNVYGLKTSGSANPTSVNDGGTGTLSSYNLYSDSALTTLVGTASLTYSVVNCCDLYTKAKATMKLILTASPNTGTWTLSQGFVVTTSGGINYAGEEFTDTSTKRIYYPTGGY
jgi:hypothetical protein